MNNFSSEMHIKPRFKTKVIAGIVLSIIITLAVVTATKNNIVFEEPDKFIYDWKASFFSTRVNYQRKDIALVYVDDDSLSSYPYKSPIDRALIASLLREIDSANPKAIGIDLIFDRPTEDKRDDALIKVLEAIRSPVVLVSTSLKESGVSSRSIDWQEGYLARANKIIASPFLGEESSKMSLGDAVVRNFGEYEPHDGEKPFSLALAEQVKKIEYHSDALIDWLLPSKDGLDVFQTFVVPAHSRVNSLGIEEGLLPPFMKSALKGKLVILGAMVSGSDWHRVPMTVATGIEVSGADIHAQMLAQLLDGRRIEKAPLYFSTMLVFVTAFLLYLALETLGERHPEIIFEFLVIAAAIIFGTIMFSRYKLNFPSAELGLAWLLVALTAKYTTKLAVKFQK